MDPLSLNRAGRIHHRSLRDDSEGAIMVAGLMMGVVMVGALYHIASVGEAILWREHLQDAADAAAFESAVWNARGMNIIVFLNYIMAAIMSLIVTIRGLVLFFTLALGIATVLRGFCGGGPWFAPLCALGLIGVPVSQTMLRVNQSLDRNLVPRLFSAIQWTRLGQEMIATITPIYGSYRAATKTNERYGVNAHGPSASLAPTWVGSHTLGQSIVPAESAAGRSRSARGARNDMHRIGRGVSLPVSWDGKWKLCEEAGKLIPREIVAAANLSDNRFFTGLTDVLGGMTGTFQGYFCGERNGEARSPLDSPEVQDELRRTAQDECDGATEGGPVTDDSVHTADERAALEPFQEFWVEGDGFWMFDGSKCRDARYEERRQELATEEVRRADRERDRGKPARVWRYTANNDFFMQSWGLAWSSPSRLEHRDRGLTFVDGQSTEHLMDAEPEERGIAQAEIYFECGSASWDDCAGNAMWLLNWRARLRRVQNPAKMAQRSVSRIAIAEVVNGIHQFINNHHQFTDRLPSGLSRTMDWFSNHVWDSHLANRGGVGVGPFRYNFPWEALANTTSSAPFFSDYTNEHDNANFIH